MEKINVLANQSLLHRLNYFATNSDFLIQISFQPDVADLSNSQSFKYRRFTFSVYEFKEFEPRLKSAKNRFQLSTGLNLEKLNTILSEINHI